MLTRKPMRTAIAAALGLSLTLLHSQSGPRFLADDPLQIDPDRLPIVQPRPGQVSQILDLVENSFAHRVEDQAEVSRAVNINTLGEVPDSSWFTRRMGRRLMTLSELSRGPDRSDGPDQSRPWTVVGMKSEGITPGFTVRDGKGEMYFVKFDPPDHPQLSTSAEVIATRFFHAFGYNVPENYLAFIERKDLVVSPREGYCGPGCELLEHSHEVATFIDEEGKERSLTERDIDQVFEKAYRDPEGKAQVVASRRISGIPLGPFRYFGTRSDDPNDVFPHQDRRELRGLRLFSAWLNHDDSRSMNSLDMYAGEPGKGHVKHYLIDFGSCFGSGSVKVQSRRAGNEYIIEWGPIVKAALTLGLWDRSWRHVKYPSYRGIGRFEAEYFDPVGWRPEYPNPAFERMQPEDAFWATRIIMRFSREMIGAIVETGRLSGPAANYLIRTLARRQDKIVRHYLDQLNPLDEFKISGDGLPRLEFRNLGQEWGLAASSSYRYEWFRFDNETGSVSAAGSQKTSSSPSIQIPSGQDDYLMVEIATVAADRPNWEKKVRVFVRQIPQPMVVGVEREPV